jgi:hypothetical protein
MWIRWIRIRNTAPGNAFSSVKTTKFWAHLSSSSFQSLLTSRNVFLPVDHMFLKGCWSLVVNLS